VNNEITVISVRPAATDEEIAAISTAVKVLWPQPRVRRHADRNHKWRFSRRKWQQDSYQSVMQYRANQS